MNSVLTKSSTIVIFAYSPVGFGHLRVTDALYHGLPEDITPVLLGSQDKAIGAVYRFISIHPLTRSLMEWEQNGIAEGFFTRLYVWYLKSHTTILYQQLITILEQRIEIPETIVVIATHFALAHQLSAIKERLEKERRIRIIVILQITDDSPQKLWYVQGADYIFSPSRKTADEFISYTKKKHLRQTNMVVNPYPVSPPFANVLTQTDFVKKKEQVDPQSDSLTHLIIPLSGAAVGTSFYSQLMASLAEKTNRFKFHVIAKSAPYTQNFLQNVLSWQNVDLHVSLSDREVVNLYEEAYHKEIISLEVTKPSEQAFKAMLGPHRRGGAILLFSDPVGRQEFDNLDFLSRYDLIPKKHEQIMLFKKSEKSEILSESNELYQKASKWRAIILPNDPKKSADFILWALKSKILLQMMRHRENTSTEELSPFGVKEFWKKVEEFLQEKEK